MRWAEVARRQGGVITLVQAVAGGLTADVVHRKAAIGEWTRVHPGVYLVAGQQLTDTARVWAAWSWAGPRAVVSGSTAAYWHGLLPRPGPEIEMTVPRARHLLARTGLRIRRRDLDPVDITRVRRMTVTRAALTVLETAVQVPDGAAFLDRALQQQQVRFRDLRTAYHRNFGARGLHPAGALLTAAAVGAESAAERLLVDLLDGAGIGGWVLGLAFGSWRIDLAFPAARVAVEVDGWAWHQRADRFQADRRKQNALVRAGWLPLRFTWHDLTRRPAAVLDEIRAALTRSA